MIDDGTFGSDPLRKPLFDDARTVLDCLPEDVPANLYLYDVPMNHWTLNMPNRWTKKFRKTR